MYSYAAVRVLKVLNVVTYSYSLANGLSQDQYIIPPLHIVHSCIVHLNGTVCQYTSFMLCCAEAIQYMLHLRC